MSHKIKNYFDVSNFKKINTKKYVGIDFSIYLHKFLFVFRQKNGDVWRTNSGKIISHIYGLYQQIIFLLNLNLIPIYVLDGKNTNLLKKKIILKRKEKMNQIREKIEFAKKMKNKKDLEYFQRKFSFIDENIFVSTINFFNACGISFIQAEGESDILLVQLQKNNQIEYILSQDFDIFLFGGDKLLFRDLKFDKLQLYEKNNLNLLVKNNLLDFYLYLGTDYNEGGVFNFGTKKTFKLLEKKIDLLEFGKKNNLLDSNYFAVRNFILSEQKIISKNKKFYFSQNALVFGNLYYFLKNYGFKETNIYSFYNLLLKFNEN